MSSLSSRPSVSELSQRVLDMAQTGVYRESVFEALQPIATKQSIRQAIAHAKKFGLYSVAQLRDESLGTYYQLDWEKYQSLKGALSESVPLDDDRLMERAIASTQMLTTVLKVAQGMAIVLLMGGLGCWVLGQRDASAGLLIGATSAGSVWLLQRRLVLRLKE